MDCPPAHPSPLKKWPLYPPPPKKSGPCGEVPVCGGSPVVEKSKISAEQCWILTDKFWFSYFAAWVVQGAPVVDIRLLETAGSIRLARLSDEIFNWRLTSRCRRRSTAAGGKRLITSITLYQLSKILFALWLTVIKLPNYRLEVEKCHASLYYQKVLLYMH